MKNHTQLLRKSLLGLAACGALLLAGGNMEGVRAQDVSTTYRSAGHDPFTKYKPPVRRKVVKKEATVIAVPVIQERINLYKAQKAAAINAQQPAPKPTTALLLNEIQVVGIFRTPRGYAAMIEATPIKLSYVVYPGEPFFNGQLVAIEENRLVFRRETRWTDGRREVAVDTKPLRQPNPIEDPVVLSKEGMKEAAKSEPRRNKEEGARGNQ
ncbi:MAG TPA: hypothetical protein VNA19_03015 [Pyrinomonadaceae bacterium]|nr:hypothetical protein [Pyrinomonadaceae bacterium]